MTDEPIWEAQTQDDVERQRSDLTFRELRAANIARQSADTGGEAKWALDQWTNALAGETGELCNLAKKVGRGLPNDPSEDDAREDLAFELADIVTYCDIIAHKLGVDLGEYVRQKFNIVSERRDSDVRL